MLRISKLADYGTVVMVHLARHPNTLMNVKSIASSTHLAVPTVSKILKLLASKHLVGSQRGTSGGYELAMPASQISVAQIITAVEGDTALTECSQAESDCSLEAVCEIRGNWQLISRAVTQTLEGVNLAELAAPKIEAVAISLDKLRRTIRN